MMMAMGYAGMSGDERRKEVKLGRAQVRSAAAEEVGWEG